VIYEEIKNCRICGNHKLVPVLNLGNQALTGVFPEKDQEVEKGPLELVKCDDQANPNACGLLQLKHNYNLSLLYGENYGYRSGLNKSMVDHLGSIVERIEKTIDLKDKDLVVDIASNDSTLLKAYKNKDLQLVGIDPTSEKFKEYYPSHVKYIPDFFSALRLKDFSEDKTKVVTSIAMFYDLENPTQFMREIYEVLDNEGIWILEQSYMPKMIENVSYDTVCHEHLEYYALKQIKWMTDKVGFKIIDVEFNEINGASFCLTLAKRSSKFTENPKVNQILEKERKEGYSEIDIFRGFEKQVEKHRKDLIDFLNDLKSKGKRVIGYGASTKGNVILQYCNLSEKDIPYIAEVNEYKFGRFTPGSLIPIISEEDAKKLNPDYFMVLPWHFKENILQREQDYLSSNGHFIFPLPKINIV